MQAFRGYYSPQRREKKSAILNPGHQPAGEILKCG
jgi:hypothetical protein